MAGIIWRCSSAAQWCSASGWASFNGMLVHFFRLPALIVTLGTASLIRGHPQFVGTRNIANLPGSIIRFSRATMFWGSLPGRRDGMLTAAFLFLVAVAALVAFMLRGTLLGRGVYALGTDPVAADVSASTCGVSTCRSMD